MTNLRAMVAGRINEAGDIGALRAAWASVFDCVTLSPAEWLMGRPDPITSLIYVVPRVRLEMRDPDAPNRIEEQIHRVPGSARP